MHGGLARIEVRLVPSLYTFDPFDIDAIFQQDSAVEELGPDATVPIVHPLIWKWRGSEWFCDWPDEDLARWTAACRDVVKLPLSEPFLRGAYDTLEQLEQAVAGRLKLRQKSSSPSDEWLQADLLQEISQLAGTGRRQGKKWWYRCPFHDDKTPSLEVDPVAKLWHCFSCDRKGGVYQWRQAIQSQ